MNRREIERQVHRFFTSAGPARDAALSEVRTFFEYPEALQALLLEFGPEISPSVAVLHRALERGRQWAWAAPRIPANRVALAAKSLPARLQR
jgi:hypothetical protein